MLAFAVTSRTTSPFLQPTSPSRPAKSLACAVLYSYYRMWVVLPVPRLLSRYNQSVMMMSTFQARKPGVSLQYKAVQYNKTSPTGILSWDIQFIYIQYITNRR